MAGKYVAFDIETAKIVPGDDFHWQPHRPLGIACIASLASGEAAPRIWLTRDAERQPAGQMSAADVAAFVGYLVDAAGQGAAPFPGTGWRLISTSWRKSRGGWTTAGSWRSVMST